jgi:hypothetical protein
MSTKGLFYSRRPRVRPNGKVFVLTSQLLVDRCGACPKGKGVPAEILHVDRPHPSNKFLAQETPEYLENTTCARIRKKPPLLAALRLAFQSAADLSVPK